MKLPCYALPVLLKFLICIEPARRQLLLDFCDLIPLFRVESELTGQGSVLLGASADLGPVYVFFPAPIWLVVWTEQLLVFRAAHIVYVYGIAFRYFISHLYKMF